MAQAKGKATRTCPIRAQVAAPGKFTGPKPAGNAFDLALHELAPWGQLSFFTLARGYYVPKYGHFVVTFVSLV